MNYKALHILFIHVCMVTNVKYEFKMLIKPSQKWIALYNVHVVSKKFNVDVPTLCLVIITLCSYYVMS